MNLIQTGFMTTQKQQTEKLLIGICNSQEDISSRFFWSFFGIHKPYPMDVTRSGHPWDAVRNNIIIQNFLDSDAEILVKMDVDQAYPPDYFTSMVPLVKKYKVIGPLIFDRWVQNGFMPLLFNNVQGMRLTKYIPEKWTGIQDVPFSHTNLFYSREVIEAIQNDRPWYDPRLKPNGLDRMNHLDFSVLQKIKNRGYPIYVNFDVVVRHIASIEIDKETHARYNPDTIGIS